MGGAGIRVRLERYFGRRAFGSRLPGLDGEEEPVQEGLVLKAGLRDSIEGLRVDAGRNSQCWPLPTAPMTLSRVQDDLAGCVADLGTSGF